MMNDNEQDLIHNSLRDLESLKRNIERDEENTRFFITEETTALYRKLLFHMKNKTGELLRQVQEWQ